MKIIYLFILAIIWLAAGVSELIGQVTFSEVMYDVSTNEYHDEFVEIYNLSEIDSVDIIGWVFSDSSGSEEIVCIKGGNKLPPRTYAIILDGSYFANSTTYDTIIPDSVIILAISDNSFGKSGLSNSVPEYLTLRDSIGNIITEYQYSIGNQPGFSDEKIDISGGNESENWSNSLIEGGTPGWTNSVAPPEIDMGFGENSLILPSLVFEYDSPLITLFIRKYGSQMPGDSILLTVFSDRNFDTYMNQRDILITRKYVPKTAHQIDITWQNIPAGYHQIVARITVNKDENPVNDVITGVIDVISRTSSLHLNEIKFLTREDESEWIELYNSGDEEIFLKNWAITDQKDTARIDSPIFILPGAFAVLCADTISDFYGLVDEQMIIPDNFPNLNNTGDVIELLQPAGSWVEKIRYDIDWLHNADYRFPSLERINPNLYENKSENWGPSTDRYGASPGRLNSIFSDLDNNTRQLTASPNPFSPDGDGFDDTTIISGMIGENYARVRVSVFDISGRLIRTLVENQYSGSHFNLVWDGRDQNGNVVRIGIYIVFVQAINDRLGVLHELKTSVVLAKRM